ncbi:MAG: Flp family type IVb pilin [Candidatus Baltobacteraceae bacterium]
MRAFSEMLADDTGGALLEYALFAAAFGGLMVSALLGIQNRTGTQFTSTTTGLTNFQISPP